MKDVLSCGQCGSRRLSGTPEAGFFCHDCGLHARVDFDNDEAYGNAPDHQDGFWSAYDSRFDGPEEEADSRQQTANSSGSGSPPEPGAGSREPGASLLTDPHSHLRCACCFELTARCRRLGARAGLRCCVGCRCSGKRT